MMKIFLKLIVLSAVFLSACSPIKPEVKVPDVPPVEINNEQLSFKKFQEMASLGHVEAQFQLGKIYDRKKRYKRALKWYQRAADQDNIMALDILSARHFLGFRAPKDAQKSLAYKIRVLPLKLQSIKDGDLTFLQSVIDSYNLGVFIPEEYKEWPHWLTKILEKDYPYKLGLIYLRGKILGFDIEKAIYWLGKAGEQGDQAAQSKLANMYAAGDKVDKDIGKAKYWYQKAADLGHVKAQFKLAYIYAKGEGGTRDYEAAFKLFLKAAEKGCAPAQSEIGWYYMQGHGVELDYQKALQWSLKAAKKGNHYAQNNLGVIYASKLPVKDYVEAEKWYLKAAKKGNDKAQTSMGWLNRKGLGMPVNYTEALKWYHRAAKQNNARAQLSIAYMHLKGQGVMADYSEAFKWAKKSAVQDHTPAQTLLGIMYGKGDGVKKDAKLSRTWLRKAAMKGDFRARNLLMRHPSDNPRMAAMKLYSEGNKLYHGKGVKQSYENAEELFIKAAESGFVRAAIKLSRMYLLGLIIPQDNEQAMNWHHVAAENDQIKAQLFLAESYLDSHNITQSVEWYSRAAELGDVKSQYILGEIVLGAYGGKKDVIEALKWFEIHAESGSKNSKPHIVELISSMSKNQVMEAHQRKSAWLKIYGFKD